ncbi:MAG: type II toxin-antitoxin system PemK/MazF family toxin [Bryobacteraceae bacterium]
MRRGEIYWADLAPRSGSEQTGRRPVILLSHDGFNQTPNWRSVIVVPMSTSTAQARRGPTAVEIPSGATGLSRPGIALCHQVTTLGRAKLTKRIGALPPDLVLLVEDALKAALDLD